MRVHNMAESTTDVDSEIKCDIRRRRGTTDHQKVDASPGTNTDGKDSVEMECSVCLQPCVHPARLPCGHIFCFLCAKGVMNQSRRCAMCRQLVPPDFFDRPELLPPSQPQPLLDGYQWFYEGRNGWWQYDERTSRELEAAYAQGSRTCELLVAGYLYVADFDAMLQMRRHEPARRRRIKRDLASTPKKGIAGLWQQSPKPSVVEAETDVETDLEAHMADLAVTVPDDSDCI